jgi:hypothetical protein
MSKPPQKRVAEPSVVPQGGFNLRNYKNGVFDGIPMTDIAVIVKKPTSLVGYRFFVSRNVGVLTQCQFDP